MIAADRPIQRPPDAKLLLIDESGGITHEPRAHFVDHLRAGDLVIANDAATLPASLQGIHEPTGQPVEIRLAARRSLAPDDVHVFAAIVFGAGDYHTRTEDRLPPPRLSRGDGLTFGGLRATILSVGRHDRLVTIGFCGSVDAVWAGLAQRGRPIQYAHVDAPLALWDVWTPVAGLPVAFEPPSAGFMLDWRSLASLQRHGVRFATITHAAGISSTGDTELDALLPFDEPYDIPVATARAIAEAQNNGHRIIAIGTTVVRALEHASNDEGRIRPGFGIATQKVTAATRLKVVDVLLTGVHEPGTSHYELMRAFADDETLQRAAAQMNELGYHTHEFGDSVLVSAHARCVVTLLGSPTITQPTLKGSAYAARLHRHVGASSGVSLSI